MFEDHQYKQFPENLLLSKTFRLVLDLEKLGSARLAGQKARLGSARQKTGSDTSLVASKKILIVCVPKGAAKLQAVKVLVLEKIRSVHGWRCFQMRI